MNTAKKIAQLQRLLDQAAQLKVHSSNDAAFKAWKNTVERTLIRVFGPTSPEVKQFSNLRFFYRAVIMNLGTDYSREHRECFDRDLNILLSSIKTYIEELQQDGDEDDEPEPATEQTAAAKVFISHASADAPFVEELIDLLEVIGLPAERIFCSSFDGYGIELGDNFLDALKEELSNDTLVLFVLSRNFYASPVCLCEMGATWVQTKEHIPILIPPFDFADIKGVIPLTQGFLINDPSKLNLFKTKIEAAFVLEPIAQSAWERKRDRIVARLNAKIAEPESSP